MKVSYNWLSKYIDLTGVDAYELAERLTNSGVAVDIVEKTNKGVENVVIGYVLESERHPNAEKLSLCKVDVGDESLQIICGASNVAKGQKVPVALVGAKLPNDVKIKKAKLRGVESQGMICSAKELGLNEKNLPKEKTEGILVLPEDSTIGTVIDPLLGLDDYILELDLTPNRSDCLSMLGVAYEVAAILKREVNLPATDISEQVSKDNKINVEIEAEEECPHYSARLLENVKITESPQWLQNTLIAAGIRPINNVVDITNYVLMEYGQPLHAFDYEKLDQPNILVRLARENERVFTLDDQERELDEQMLLITDGVKPIAIAGVMGLANSEVTESTTKILLESAYFNGATVRRTSKKLGLRSEASLRFEKGVDPNRIYAALNRASELLQQIAGATLVGDIYEKKVKSYGDKEIHLNPDRVNQLLGTSLTKDDMMSIFNRLRFDVSLDNQQLLVKIPTRRQDIAIEADLIEEIARLYGYDNIPTTLPSGVYIQGGLNQRQKLRRKIKALIEASGLQEVITYSFTGNQQQDMIKELKNNKKPISLSMPLSEDKQYLRTSLLPSLLEVANYNINRRIEDVSIYEIGTTFFSNEEELTNLPEEKLVLSGLMTGSPQTYWKGNSEKIDFYLIKGIVTELFDELGLKDVEYRAAAIKGFHPGRTAEIYLADNFLGYIGQLYPELQEKYDLKDTYAFELDLQQMMNLADIDVNYRPLPKYPAIQRDIAILVSKDILIGDITKEIHDTANKLLEDLTLFDVYTGDQVSADKKSVAFSLTFRSAEKTLTDEEVTKVYDKILAKLQDKYQAELRK